MDVTSPVARNEAATEQLDERNEAVRCGEMRCDAVQQTLGQPVVQYSATRHARYAGRAHMCLLAIPKCDCVGRSQLLPPTTPSPHPFQGSWILRQELLLLKTDRMHHVGEHRRRSFPSQTLHPLIIETCFSSCDSYRSARDVKAINFV